MSAEYTTSSPIEGQAHLGVFLASDLNALVAPVLDEDPGLRTTWAALSAEGRDKYRYDVAAQPYTAGLEHFNAFAENEAYCAALDRLTDDQTRQFYALVHDGVYQDEIACLTHFYEQCQLAPNLYGARVSLNEPLARPSIVDESEGTEAMIRDEDGATVDTVTIVDGQGSDEASRAVAPSLEVPARPGAPAITPTSIRPIDKSTKSHSRTQAYGPADPSIPVRALPEGGWHWTHNNLVKAHRLSPVEFTVYACLAEHANPAQQCWIAVGTIAAERRCSHNSVRKALRRLVSLKLVRIERRLSSHGQTSNKYTLLEPEIPKNLDLTSPTTIGRPALPNQGHLPCHYRDTNKTHVTKTKEQEYGQYIAPFRTDARNGGCKLSSSGPLPAREDLMRDTSYPVHTPQTNHPSQAVKTKLIAPAEEAMCDGEDQEEGWRPSRWPDPPEDTNEAEPLPDDFDISEYTRCWVAYQQHQGELPDFDIDESVDEFCDSSWIWSFRRNWDAAYRAWLLNEDWGYQR
jgi:hypothetical protein